MAFTAGEGKQALEEGKNQVTNGFTATTNCFPRATATDVEDKIRLLTQTPPPPSTTSSCGLHKHIYTPTLVI